MARSKRATCAVTSLSQGSLIGTSEEGRGSLSDGILAYSPLGQDTALSRAGPIRCPSLTLCESPDRTVVPAQ
eukprot:587324-Hanusia_phi.AAC.1